MGKNIKLQGILYTPAAAVISKFFTEELVVGVVRVGGPEEGQPGHEADQDRSRLSQKQG